MYLNIFLLPGSRRQISGVIYFNGEKITNKKFETPPPEE
jgi:hypothetical protein